MVKIFDRHASAATNEQAVAAAEKALGVRLPEDYKRFLLEYNGGTPEPNRFFIKGVDDYALVDLFFGVGHPHDDLVKFFDELKEDTPPKHVPIGLDPGGNALLMDLSEEGASKIYYWDSARAFEQSTDEENTYLVGNSFSDFLKRLSA